MIDYTVNSAELECKNNLIFSANQWIAHFALPLLISPAPAVNQIGQNCTAMPSISWPVQSGEAKHLTRFSTKAHEIGLCLRKSLDAWVFVPYGFQQAHNLFFSDNSETYWFIYLTNWAFFCLCVSVLVHSAITVTEYTTAKIRGNYDGVQDYQAFSTL